MKKLWIENSSDPNAFYQETNPDSYLDKTNDIESWDEFWERTDATFWEAFTSICDAVESLGGYDNLTDDQKFISAKWDAISQADRDLELSDKLQRRYDLDLRRQRERFFDHRVFFIDLGNSNLTLIDSPKLKHAEKIIITSNRNNRRIRGILGEKLTCGQEIVFENGNSSNSRSIKFENLDTQVSSSNRFFLVRDFTLRHGRLMKIQWSDYSNKAIMISATNSGGGDDDDDD